MTQRKVSTSTYPIVFFMADSTDHVTGKTGLTPTVTISKNGGAFGAALGAVAEIASGWYSLAGNATDRNTPGALAIHATASGADPADVLVHITSMDPFALSVPGDAMALTSDERTSIGTAVWGSTTRTLSSFGTLVSDIWGNAIRTLSAFSFTVATNLDSNVTAIKAKTDNLPSNPAAVGDAMTLTSAYDAAKTASTQASIDTVDTVVDAIKAKTDNLPASPAAIGSAMTLTVAYDKAKDDVLTPLAVVDGIVDAIKAKTDNLPASPAATGDAMTLTAAYENAKADVIVPLSVVDGIVDSIKAKTDNLPANPAAIGSAMTLTSAYDNSKSDVLTPLAVVDGVVDAIKTTIDTNLDGKISSIVLNPTVNANIAIPMSTARRIAEGEIELKPFLTFEMSFSSTLTSNLGTASKLWFAIKEKDVTDANSLIFIEKTGGLTVVNRAAYGTAAHGTISVSGSAGDWTVTVWIDEAATSLLSAHDGSEFRASVKAKIGNDVYELRDDNCVINLATIRTVS